MSWLMDHLSVLMTCLLVVSEALAAVFQILFPDNKGVSGFLAGLIKLLQALGAKDPEHT